VASPRREIRRLLAETGAGILAADEPPHLLAGALNGLGEEAIARMRAAALEAAERLNWDAEAGRLVAAVEAAHRGSRTARSRAGEA
jgi:hypothetical protein